MESIHLIALPPNTNNAEMEAYWAKVPIDYARLLNHFSEFVHAGDLVVDLGAERGNYVWLWRELGARVVAVEPMANQNASPYDVRQLIWKYSNDPMVTILPVAVSDTVGEVTLVVSRTTGGDFLLPSIDPKWIGESAHKSYYNKLSDRYVVPTITLDDIVREHGEIQFLKCDIEGGGRAAFRGLSSPVKAGNAETHFDWLFDLRESFEHLSTLARYEFNFSLGTGGAFSLPTWVSCEELVAWLDANLDKKTGWGDGYYRRVDDV